MTNSEIITAVKTFFPNGDAKIVKGNVYAKKWFEKRFSFYKTLENATKDLKEYELEMNALINSREVNNFIKNLGYELHATSGNSCYYMTKNGIVRISNHHWTSEKHIEPALNLCSYKKNAYENLIDELQKFLNK